VPVSFFGSATAMLGMFAGDLLRSGRASLTGARKALYLALIGLAVGLAGWGVSFSCPIIKKLWTPSFMLVVGGYSFVVLALFYWIIDVRGWRKWAFFFKVIGMNAITIYILMRIVDFAGISKFFFSGIADMGDKPWQVLVLTIGRIAIEWLLLLYLYRKKTFLRA
jgi:predicted acyltransferase